MFSGHTSPFILIAASAAKAMQMTDHIGRWYIGSEQCIGILRSPHVYSVKHNIVAARQSIKANSQTSPTPSSHLVAAVAAAVWADS